MKKRSPISIVISFIAAVLIFSYLGVGRDGGIFSSSSNVESHTLLENGVYTSVDDVAQYIYEYHRLPKNYITKDKAKSLGWDPEKNYLGDVAPLMSIGGDKFGNFEGKLDKKQGRKYYEADIDYDGKERNAKRIVFSNDGLIYYTDDHYNTFDLLYDEGGKKWL